MRSKLHYITEGNRFITKSRGLKGTVLAVKRSNNGNHHYATKLDEYGEMIFLFYAEDIKELDSNGS